MKILRIVFFGSGEFALPTLERLFTLHEAREEYQLLSVVSRPDRPAGRGRRSTPTPVRKRACELGLEVFAPPSANDAAFLDSLEAASPDLFIVADYGELLRRRLRSIPPLGTFNLHASILPRYRGASPVAHAIMNGDTTTGVSLFRIVKELDAGPLVATTEVEIDPTETTGVLEGRLAMNAADLLEEQLPRFLLGTVTEVPQDDSAALHAPKLAKKQGEIDWSLEARRVFDHLRAMTPWPGAFSFLCRKGRASAGQSERIRILEVSVGDAAAVCNTAPGTVLEASRGTLLVACGVGTIAILRLQRPGKSPLDTETFLRGWTIEAGDRFISTRESSGG